MVPSLHKTYLSVIVDRVFCRCAERLVEKLRANAVTGTGVNMEEKLDRKSTRLNPVTSRSRMPSSA